MKRIISILLCVLWMGFIFYNSSENGTDSNGLTYKIVDKLISISEQIQKEDTNNVVVYASPKAINIKNTSFNFSIKDILRGDRESLNKQVRKAAHAFEFLVLALLLCNAFFTWNFKGRKAIIYILFIVLFYAVTDEFHQIYVIGRGSSVKDVLIDFIGGIIGTILYYTCYYLVRKIKKKAHY